MTNKTELLPCPFCGDDEAMDFRANLENRVQCSGCNVSTDTFPSSEESHAAWNTRTAPAEDVSATGASVAGRVRAAIIADQSQEGVDIAKGRFGMNLAVLCRQLDGEEEKMRPKSAPAEDVPTSAGSHIQDGMEVFKVHVGEGQIAELVDRAHVTRLTAERDGLLAEVEKWRASNKANALAAGELVAGLQSELTKARGLVWRMDCEDRLDHCQAIQDLYQWARKSAPAAKGDSDEQV